MNINNNLYKYLNKSKNQFIQDKFIKREIDNYIIKSFKNNNNDLNNFALKSFGKYFKSKEIISDNVIIVNDLKSLLINLKADNFIFIVSKNSFKSFNKTYSNFLKNKQIFYFENIKNGHDLIKLIKLIKLKNLHILCIGGGRVQDISKFVSYKSKKILLCIPTILATHVYASPKIHALNQIKDLGYDLTIDGNASNLSIIDLNIIKKLFLKNRRFIFSGMGDLMAFYNSKLDWQLSNTFNLKKNLFVFKAIKDVEKTLENMEINKPIEKWLTKYIFAQVLLCNITHWVGSAPASGAEHFFANIFEKKFKDNLLHGELVALGTLIFRYLRNNNYELILNLIKKFKINKFIKKSRLTNKKIIETLLVCKKEGIRKKRSSILNLIQMNKKDWEKIIKEMHNKKLLYLR